MSVKKRKSSATISRGNKIAAVHQAEMKVKNQINLLNDGISEMKKRLLSLEEKTAELTDSNTMTNKKMDKIVASTQKMSDELTNINTMLIKALTDKEEEAKKTSTELEKALITLAESETAKDKLSGEVTHYRAILAQNETTLISLQALVEKEQWNLEP